MLFLRSGAVVLTLVVGWLLWAIATESPPVPATSVSLASDDGVDLLSVSARAVPLRALLSEVARLAGFEVTGLAAMDRMVSVEFKSLPLDRALRRLLSGESFVFVYSQLEGSATKLIRVILVGSDMPQQGGSIAEPAIGLSGGAYVVAVSEESAQIIPKAAQTFNFDAPLEELLPLTSHPDPKMRTAALEALTLHAEDERARRTLMDHIGDPDPSIRSKVLGLLGPFVIEWTGAQGALMTALRDPIPSVRELALHALWEASIPGVSEALHLALQDEDPEVRALAAELLHGAAVEDSSEK